ncbi:hypothetical protein HX109_12220 [Galbibacter sp. BG1]|uniref:hypothetical protein n=1 Tax=Galbibacter sp. BG1 TaxID=1170699 RepID=UPI0015BBB0CF|nr:hypothetical protein [Galbibacter sp. BG1]QLE02286.1 hypothetical protein HX109_12220 [Galbibacter sp. BG1]
MSEIIEIVDSLESKVGKLLDKLKQAQETNRKLKEELAASKNENKDLANSIEAWEANYESLKLANSMLGSNENKTEAKLKINTLIREIDQCITQLSE